MARPVRLRAYCEAKYASVAMTTKYYMSMFIRHVTETERTITASAERSICRTINRPIWKLVIPFCYYPRASSQCSTLTVNITWCDVTTIVLLFNMGKMLHER